jgi:cytochrome c
LSLKDAPAARADPSGGKKYEYTLEDGKTVTLDFPLFVEGMEKDKKVTKGVFRGYELYNSYCFRCHGTDATESELAPSLRHALEVGMTPQRSGGRDGGEKTRDASWAPFLSEEEMTNIYRV